MIKQFANTITSFLLNDNIIEEDNKEIYQFGIERILKNLIIIFVISIIASVLKNWIETIFIFVGFIPLRKFGGGYHADTLLTCNFLTTLIYLINIFCINYFKNIITFQAFIILCLITMIFIFRFAPVDHKNFEFDSEMIVKAKKNVRISVLILIVISSCLVYILNEVNLISLSIMTGAFTGAVSIFLGSIKRRGEKNEEKLKVSA